ncbi:MAG: hypothetical protein EA417_21445, partial [Gammaproteobacteria bacterium]
MFGGWTGACESADTSCEVSMVSAREVTARFDRTFEVTASAGTGGSIEPALQTVTEGETVDLIVMVDEGFGIESVSGCGGALTDGVFTTAAITEHCEVLAAFEVTL